MHSDAPQSPQLSQKIADPRRGHDSRVLTAFGINVRHFRRQAGMTQAELGAKIGADHGYVGDIERGARNPTLLTASKIAQGLNVELYRLYVGI